MMKQPELGLKILQLRKTKGLTQEELVERCNINVRTIQRIEAGEVTPRSYTIKGILEALDYDLTAIQLEDEKQKNDEGNHKNRRGLIVAFFVGIGYLVLAFIEGLIDFMPVIGETPNISTEGSGYVIIKIAVIATYSVFMWGYYNVSLRYRNEVVMFSSILLVIGTGLTLTADVYAIYTGEISFLSVQLFKSVLLGAMYVSFGIGLISYRFQFGTFAMITGILGIISGIAFLSVVLALPGLIVFTIFEVCQLILLYKMAHYKPVEKPKWRSEEIPALP